MKLFLYDLETTGTLYWKHGIHQLAGRIIIDHKIVEEFNYNIRPNPKALIEQKALDVGKVTQEQIMNYPPMGEVFKDVIDMMGKYVNKWERKQPHRFHLVGYNNTQFDNNFLKAWFAQNGEEYFYSWFWYDSLDVMTMAAQRFAHVRQNLKGFKLMDIARYLNIKTEEEKLHDADYDIDITHKCFDQLYQSIEDEKDIIEILNKQKIINQPW